MLNRAIEMKLVKKSKHDAPGTMEQTTENVFDYGLAVEGVTKVVINELGKCVLAYMAADTVRKIVINRMSK